MLFFFFFFFSSRRRHTRLQGDWSSDVCSSDLSPNRLAKPLYRAPGSDHWEDISWENAVERIAQKIRKTRDETWVATEKLGDSEVPVNRTDAIAFMGGAQNTNEECYLFQKATRLLGIPFVEHQARL